MQDRFRFRVWNIQKDEIKYDVLDDFEFYLKYDEIFDVMQCTGLKDKNGKLIYEGDIVKANYITPSGKEIEKICTVKFDRCAYWIGDKYSASYLDNEDVIYEVIGNIYENKELLNE